MSNLTSRTIAGGLMTLLGLFLIVLPLFASLEEAWFAPLIYGVPLLILGLFLLFNSKEDKIERIKSRRKK